MQQSPSSFRLWNRVALVVMLLALGLVFAGFAHVPTAHAAPAISTQHGCPPYYACIYPENKGWNNNHPSLEYYYYGVYQLYNQFGPHNVYNNQSPGFFWLCTNSAGTNCPIGFGPGSYGYNINLTPIYSVKLTSNGSG